MTNIIEVTENLDGENFAVDPDAMHNFLEFYFDIDSIPVSSDKIEKFIKKYAEEIERICQDAHMNKGGYSDLLHIDYAPGIYSDELPACGWVEVED